MVTLLFVICILCKFQAKSGCCERRGMFDTFLVPTLITHTQQVLKLVYKIAIERIYAHSDH